MLTAVTDLKSAKSQIKDNSNALNDEKEYLFREAFRKNLKEITKAQENVEKVFSRHKSSAGTQ